MKPPAFRYERPGTLAEALVLLAEHGDDARPLAGGQSLVPMLNLRLAAPAVLVDLNGLPGLDDIATTGPTLVVGALTRQRSLELALAAVNGVPHQPAGLEPGATGIDPATGFDPVTAIGALADSLPLVGHVATRNRGTVGGSVAHADPAAELPLALLALGGSVVADGPAGRREIQADDLFAGFLTTTLVPGELLVEMRFPAPGLRDGSALVEVAQRHGDFPLAAVAVSLRLSEDGHVAHARIAAGAVADRPLLLPAAAEALIAGAGPEEAGRVGADEVDPHGTLHAPADYQRHLVLVLVARAIDRALARARPAPERPDSGTVDTSRRIPPENVPGTGRVAGDNGRGGAREPPSPSSRRIFRRIPHEIPPRMASGAGSDGRPPGQFTVNGRSVSLDGVPDRRLLSDFLRHDLGLRGTHVGCEHGVCGACTIRLDGVAVRSCLLLARQADSAGIETVEGLAAGDDARTLHPLQAAFGRHYALQCGFCTPGILMAAAEMLDSASAAGAGPPPDEDDIRRLLSGHLCRCTGYEPIVAAIAELCARIPGHDRDL